MMRNFTLLIVLFISFFTLQAQDILMQNGTFNQCSGTLYDSGGSASNYGNNENFVLTLCPDAADQFISLNFTQFGTQAVNDVLTIYDGDDTTAPIIGTYSGGGAANNPGTVSASTTSATGCLTLEFVSDATGPTVGWAAEISCLETCQTITPSIDSTTPAANGAGIVEVPVGTNVVFNGSATFSDDPTGATYNWNFGDGNADAGEVVNHTFNTVGTFTTTLTVTDPNPTGCSEQVTITVVVLSPLVTINSAAYPESSFGPEQLISDVLVSGGCSGVDNFTFQVSGGTGDLTTKSYGYFRQGGAVNFPFEEGVILTTGQAFGGGNTTAVPANPNPSNNNGQPGDADLEAALGQTNTNDATFIKFNFVPTANSISFRFLMASEEYDGNTECSFADSFAFLLREVGTTAYTNLAVLPDGTPVSVTNINNSGNCTANPAFFEGYNLPDTNYGGRTVVLTAMSNVTPNTTYEIKLVVADQGDSIWDSAIFLEAGSFNLGGDLGDDVTIAAGTSVCEGDTVSLNTGTDASVAHVWYFEGVEIPGETGPTLDVTQQGNYSVDVVFAASCVANDSIFVEFIPGAQVDTVNNLVECNNGSGPVIFDLTENTAPALGAQDPAVYAVSYHNTALDATNGTNAIADPANYTGTDGEIIHIRVENAATMMCPATDSFELQFLNVSLNPAPDMEVCDDISNDGTETFDLQSQTAAILGTQAAADYTVTYHLDFANADAGTAALPNMYDNTTSPEPIFVRIESVTDPDCYIASATTVFNLIVNPRAVATQPMDMVVCDDTSGDGVEVFDLTTQEPAILGGQNPANYTVSYYENAADGDTPTPMNAIPNPTTYTNTGSPQTIFVRVDDNTNPTCYGFTSFDLIVNPLPVIPVLPAYEICDNDDDGDATNGIAEFDLSTIDASAING
ncbi:choice-of-anchor L domain-containing protein, partial [Pontimicrobium sp. MEBiC01747]